MWISLILSQKFISLKLLHLLNASIPIIIPSLDPLLISTCSSDVHPENENLGISTHPPGRTIDFNTGLFLNSSESVFAAVKYLNSSKFSTPSIVSTYSPSSDVSVIVHQSLS